MHDKELILLNAHYIKVLENVSGSHDVEMFTKNSTISSTKNKLDDAMIEKHNSILSHDTAVLSAVKDAKDTERNHHSAQMRSEKKSLASSPQTYLRRGPLYITSSIVL